VRRTEHVSIETIRDDRLWMHRALDVPALVIIVVERLKIDVTRGTLRTGETREVAESHASPLFNGGPSFHAVVIHSLGKSREFLQIIERQFERMIHHSGNFEGPLASLGLIPNRNSLRHVVARQSVASEVRPGESGIHVSVSQKRALDHFILSLRIPEQSLCAFWTA